MAWQLTRSLDALRSEIKQGMPNVTIYTIGDEAHRLRTSDHNPDDTAGSNAEQSDSDSTQEVRAIDIMLNVSDESMRIVKALTDPRSRARLKYVIHGGKIWSRSNGWAVEPFTSDPHNDHIHVSGLAADDANGAAWPAVAEIWEDEDDMFEDKDRDALTSANYRTYGLWQDLDEVGFTITSGRKFAEKNLAKAARVALEQKVSAMLTALAGVDDAVAAQLKGRFDQIDAGLAATRAEVADVDEQVASRLGADDLTAQEKADLLRTVLGDDTAAVGALLAQG